MSDIEAIKNKYDAGELLPIQEQLLHFIRLHHAQFFCFLEKEKATWGKPVEEFTALRLFILDRKTIDFRSEMLSQVEEINKEVLERGCGCDPQQIRTVKEEWLRNHAASWRAHRILEIIYVLNRNREYFLDYLHSPELNTLSC